MNERNADMLPPLPLRQTRWRWLLVIGLASLFGVVGVKHSVASPNSGAVFLHPVPSALFNDQTNSISVGVDPAGGMHAAFANFSTDPNGNYNAYYAYCPPGVDCANTTNWPLV